MSSNQTEETTDTRINVPIDPEKKKLFKMFCVMKDTTQTDAILEYVDTCIESISPKKS